jgi:zinc protease
VGAVTTTNPENAIPALEVMLETMQELREAPPTDRELGTAVSRVVNGFVFNFQTPAQVVSRVMFYLADDLPEDWLERYSRGIQEITPEQVQEVFADHLYPEEMTILVVGDVDRIGRAALERLGPVTVLRAD